MKFSSGIHNWGIFDINSYKLFLVNVDDCNYTFIIYDRYFLLSSELFVISKTDFKRLFSLVLSMSDRTCLSYVYISPDFYEFLIQCEHQTKLTMEKDKLLKGIVYNKSGSVFSISTFLRDIDLNLISGVYCNLYSDNISYIDYMKMLGCDIRPHYKFGDNWWSFSYYTRKLPHKLIHKERFYKEA